MATQVKKVAQEAAAEAERSPLLETVHKVLLAGIGAVALAQDEVEDFVNKLVERGEIAEVDGKKLIKEVMDRRKKDAQKAEAGLDRRIEEILSRMNIPTKSEIEALSQKITALTKKVEELKKPA
jgi:poly(hydroxyalkanoate) granule-associated protein